MSGNKRDDSTSSSGAEEAEALVSFETTQHLTFAPKMHALMNRVLTAINANGIVMAEDSDKFLADVNDHFEKGDKKFFDDQMAMLRKQLLAALSKLDLTKEQQEELTSALTQGEKSRRYFAVVGVLSGMVTAGSMVGVIKGVEGRGKAADDWRNGNPGEAEYTAQYVICLLLAITAALISMAAAKILAYNQQARVFVNDEKNIVDALKLLDKMLTDTSSRPRSASKLV